MATVGEEMEQAGSSQLYEKGYADDLDALLIAEPPYPSLVYAHKGSMDSESLLKVDLHIVQCHS